MGQVFSEGDAIPSLFQFYKKYDELEQQDSLVLEKK